MSVLTDMFPWQINLVRQLEELHLIRCSLLPGESFSFVLPQKDLAIWTSLLDAFTDAGSFSHNQDGVIASLTHPPCQARFDIRAVGAQTWFEVALPLCIDVDIGSGGNGAKSIMISVKGEHVSRDAHDRWNTEIRARTAEIDEASA